MVYIRPCQAIFNTEEGLPYLVETSGYENTSEQINTPNSPKISLLNYLKPH